jgi:signal transduction histidine kinase
VPSLRRRLTAAILAATALLLVLTGLAVYFLQRRALTRAFDQTLLAKARALRSDLRMDRETRQLVLEGDRLRRPRRMWRPRGPDWRPGPPDGDREEGPERPDRRRRRRPDRPEPDDHEDQEDRPSPTPDDTDDVDEPAPAGDVNPPDWFRVRTATGSVLLQSQGDPPDVLPAAPPPEGEPYVTEVNLSGRPARMAILRFTRQAGGPPHRRPPPLDLVLLAADDTEALREQLAATGWVLLGCFTAALVLAGLAAWTVSAASLKPVARLAGRIGHMREDDLSDRLDADALPQELQPVAARLNDLLQRVQSAMMRERGFTADVAHELRTPLAGLSAAAEIALSQDRDGQEYRDALAETLTVTRQMEQMVEKLLALARLDAGQITPQAEVVSLRRLLLRTWQGFVESAEAKSVGLAESLAHDLYCSCDGHLIEMIASNLLANAVEYAKPGGEIRLAATDRGDRVELTVENTVESAPPPEHLRAMFERFWRADAARGETGMHCGLGLSLVRRCAQTLGGSVEAAATDEPAVRITVSLPRGAPPA